MKLTAATKNPSTLAGIRISYGESYTALSLAPPHFARLSRVMVH